MADRTGGRRVGPALLAPTLLATALSLAGCGQSDDDPGPGGVTVGEARALDEAAEMLDAQRLPEDALREAAAVGEASDVETQSVPTEPATEPAVDESAGR